MFYCSSICGFMFNDVVFARIFKLRFHQNKLCLKFVRVFNSFTIFIIILFFFNPCLLFYYFSLLDLFRGPFWKPNLALKRGPNRPIRPKTRKARWPTPSHTGPSQAKAPSPHHHVSGMQRAHIPAGLLLSPA